MLFEASKDGERKLLSDGEMIADIIFILLAGYDTTSNTLAYTAYLLAINPEVQEVLANHILTYFEENPVSTCRGREQGHIPFEHARECVVCSSCNLQEFCNPPPPNTV